MNPLSLTGCSGYTHYKLQNTVSPFLCKGDNNYIFCVQIIPAEIEIHLWIDLVRSVSQTHTFVCQIRQSSQTTSSL